MSPTFSAAPPRTALLVVLAAGFWAGCSSSGTNPTTSAPSGAGAGAAAGTEIGSSGAPSAGAPSGVSGAVGAATGGTGGAQTAGGVGGSIAGAAGAAAGGAAGSAAGAANGGASAGSGGSTAKGGAAAGGAAAGGAIGTAGAGAAGANNCNLPATVGFQKDVQPFLTSSCGKGVGSGCHVTDNAKTSLGYDHAYDWITAFAHTGSCGGPPYVKRFEVVIAVINGANPASCPKSRIMPPPGMPAGTPLTTCQIAALQAWLDEPEVSQMHVPETDDTKDLYPPGPYLMPPFN